jgi:hypothetical protein
MSQPLSANEPRKPSKINLSIQILTLGLAFIALVFQGIYYQRYPDVRDPDAFCPWMWDFALAIVSTQHPAVHLTIIITFFAMQLTSSAIWSLMQLIFACLLHVDLPPAAQILVNLLLAFFLFPISMLQLGIHISKHDEPSYSDGILRLGIVLVLLTRYAHLNI